MNTKEKTKQHFNETAFDYNDSDDGKFVQEMYDVLVDEILKLDSGNILDVGCGNANLFNLLPNGKYGLFGIDFSENMIIEANNNCNVDASFRVADAERLPFDDDTFDMIVCNASFHHYIHPNAVLCEMHRVLKDGGKVLIGDPYIPTPIRGLMNKVLKYSDEGDYHIYGLNEMESLFEDNCFSPISSQKTGRRTALHIAVKA